MKPTILFTVIILFLFQHNLQAQTYVELTGTANPLGAFDVGDASHPAFMDIDSNGFSDLISGDANGLFSIIYNDGPSGFFNALEHPLLGEDVGDTSSASVIDINNDGNLDFLAGDANGTFELYINNGYASLNLAGTNYFNSIDVGDNSSPTFVDIDSDGDLDLVSGTRLGPLKVYTNNNNTFTELTTHPFTSLTLGTNTDPCFVDIDNDGDQDLVCGNALGTIETFLNNGSNVFSAATANPFASIDVGDLSTPTFADIDSDGDLDLISGNGAGEFKVFENISTPVGLKDLGLNARIVNQSDVVLEFLHDDIEEVAMIEVQHSQEGNEWTTLESIDPKKDHNYQSYTHSNAPSGENFYRIKFINDSEVSYSQVAYVNIGVNQSNIAVFPNPTKDQFTINGLQGVSEISLYDPLGRLINKMEPTSKSEVTIDLTHMKIGSYYIHIKHNGQTTTHNIHKI